MAGTASGGNDLLLRSFARSLRARNRSPKTISSYGISKLPDSCQSTGTGAIFLILPAAT